MKHLKYSRNAVHSIVSDLEFSFNPQEYSRFKFGDQSIVEKFGLELFNYFIKHHFDKIHSEKRLIIYSSPYSSIPTASFYLTQSFKNLLENSQHLESIKVVMGKINRLQTYVVDYGFLDAHQRFELIKNDTYEFEDLPTSEDYLIFIDDISITGSHQLVVENLLSKHKLSNNLLFLYYAQLDSDKIHPSIENFLNYSEVKNLEDTIYLVTSYKFNLNTRFIKFLLCSKESELDLFIERISKFDIEIINQIVHLAYQNGYNKIQAYQDNLNKIQENLSSFNKNINIKAIK
jgi:hypothetical protein